MTLSSSTRGSASTGKKRVSARCSIAVRRLRQAQQRLRGHDHQRALLGDPRLAAQQVEVLRRRRQVRDADVALGGELQEALQARARSAPGPSPRSRAAAAASGASSGPTWPAPETMNWSMITCARVDEVAELRLPQHERLRRLHRVAVLEAEAGDLRQRRVVQLHRRQRARQVLDRRDALAGLRRRAGPGGAGENVPRSASWPVRRTGVPSVSSEAKASASACAQSMPPSAPSASRRRSSCLTSFGWTVKPSGTRSSSSLSVAQARRPATAVLTSGDGERSSS